MKLILSQSQRKNNTYSKNNLSVNVNRLKTKTHVQVTIWHFNILRLNNHNQSLSKICLQSLKQFDGLHKNNDKQIHVNI